MQSAVVGVFLRELRTRMAWPWARGRKRQTCGVLM